MFKKRNAMKQVVVFVLVFVFSVLHMPTAYAAGESANELDVYISKLSELNKEFGTSYAIPDKSTYEATGQDYEKLISFYTNMSLAEFESYIREVNNKIDEYAECSESNDIVCQAEALRVAPVTKSKTQKFVFLNGNYFSLNSTIYTGEGNIRYSRINSIGESIKVYPAYRIKSATYNFNSDCTVVTVTFVMNKYATETLMYTVTPTNLTVQFAAFGGDIYETTEV